MSVNHQHNDTIESLRDSLKYFGTADYLVFIAMLLSCTVVGLYFGYEDYKKKKQVLNLRRGSEAIDYLVGGRNMKIFPVAMSLVASCISGIALLGTSTEIYLYGYQYSFILIGYLIAAYVLHHTVIPIFHELQITSAYEYLQLRFDKKVRLFGSVMFSLSTLLWMPIAIYVPALAFSQTTGMDVHMITPVVMFICIFYTCLGGIKAVVWTDVIQIMIMYGTLILINVKGTFEAGGLSVVIERNIESGRLAMPDFNIDPTIRISFWTMVIGGSFFRTYMGINQSMIQRFMALKNVHVARKCQMTYMAGILILNLMCYYNGLLLYATYHDCDPLTTKLAKAKDQIMPLYVTRILKNLPGLSGLFIAGVFSASLSSLSTALNSFSAVVLEDFCKPYMKNEISEKMSAIIMRATVLIVGIIAVALVYVVQHMGSVLQLAMTIPSICFGPMLGVYIIGILIPWIDKRATLYGALTGCVAMIAFISKVQTEVAMGNITYPMKPVSVEGCTYEFNAVNITNNHAPPDRDFFHLSFMYYTLLGSTIVILSSVVYSLIFGFHDPSDVDLRLLAPFIRKYFVVDLDVKEQEMIKFVNGKNPQKIEYDENE
ncbi:sodium-coupled monocarboxylate transporter 1-like [Chironomus tepperi]|uniref:sodium-coupled monocarboxylate transporter 1-like n=1 Tax=Chironomus tepperi TaxID=113505 RepID=UPI00391F32E4